eukprot:COSAG01_NODE_375_length_17945_cov_175.968284_14_plen_91_part_00
MQSSIVTCLPDLLDWVLAAESPLSVRILSRRRSGLPVYCLLGCRAWFKPGNPAVRVGCNWVAPIAGGGPAGAAAGAVHTMVRVDYLVRST